MSSAVVDASILAAFYAADDPRRVAVAARLSRGDALYAPGHLDVEVASALRSMARRNSVLRAAAPSALEHLARFPIRRMPIGPLLGRIWELRHAVSAYDAAYVALAERLDCPLWTADRKLAGTNGPGCRIVVIG